MDIKELKEKITNLPDHMDVMIETPDAEFDYSLLNTAEIMNITFRDGRLKAEDKCLVLAPF